MSEPTQTIEGWYAYHEFRTIDWALLKTVSDVQRDEEIQEYAILRKPIPI